VNSPGSSNGFGTNAKFNNPSRLSISPSGDYAIVPDQGNHRIRRINISTAEVTTLAGSGTAGNINGAATNARFNNPRGVAISSQAEGAYVLVADGSNNLIRRITDTAMQSGDPSGMPTGSLQSRSFLGFGVKIGDHGVLSSGKIILVSYLQRVRCGEFPERLFSCSLSFLVLFLF
jgi:DNA-binding beta-propeller fold protein YncE